jgi:ferredoxin
MKRKIVSIDRDRCDGCGLCLPNCAEGALKVIDGQAVLVSAKFCDGLGACLGHCPQDAIRIVERDADEYDERAVRQRQLPEACPGSRVSRQSSPTTPANSDHTLSELTHWPIQLHLAPIDAPFFQNVDLLLAASCVPFACGNFHSRLLAGRSLLIACPKLDRTDPYLDKLSEIFKNNALLSVAVAVMEVPCCQGLVRLARQAMERSGKDIPLKVSTVGIHGSVREE